MAAGGWQDWGLMVCVFSQPRGGEEGKQRGIPREGAGWQEQPFKARGNGEREETRRRR